MKSTLAYGTCNTCGQYDTAIGADAQDAKLMFRQGHGKKHLFDGVIETRLIQQDEAYKLERARRVA